MNDQIQTHGLRKQRLILVLVVVVFVAPIAGSWLVFNFTSLGRDSDNHGHGILIDPARQLDDMPLAEPAGTGNSTLLGKWSLVYLLQGDCEQVCEDNLYRMRQLRLAMGQNADRVQRVVLVDGDPVRALGAARLQDYAGQLAGTAGPGVLSLFSLDAGESPPSRHRLYLIDPRGFLIMAYPPETEPQGIIRDLKRLLRYSRIG